MNNANWDGLTHIYSPYAVNFEFYRSNVGPGSYNPTDEAIKTKIQFSFSKDSRLKQTKPHGPGAGTYKPSHCATFRTYPKWVIGTSAKCDSYWMDKMVRRSPGPIYKYVLNSDSTSKYKQNCVVFY